MKCNYSRRNATILGQASVIAECLRRIRVIASSGPIAMTKLKCVTMYQRTYNRFALLVAVIIDILWFCFGSEVFLRFLKFSTQQVNPTFFIRQLQRSIHTTRRSNELYLMQDLAAMPANLTTSRDNIPQGTGIHQLRMLFSIFPKPFPYLSTMRKFKKE